MNVLLFGALVDVVGKSKIEVPGTDLDSLNKNLLAEHPNFKKYKFRFAVNREIAINNIPLHEGDEIALLPPFAGG